MAPKVPIDGKPKEAVLQQETIDSLFERRRDLTCFLPILAAQVYRMTFTPQKFVHQARVQVLVNARNQSICKKFLSGSTVANVLQKLGYPTQVQ